MMFGFEHAQVVAFAKTYGLFYIMALAIAVLTYTFWPSNKARFDRAARAAIDDEDKPCQ